MSNADGEVEFGEHQDSVKKGENESETDNGAEKTVETGEKGIEEEPSADYESDSQTDSMTHPTTQAGAYNPRFAGLTVLLAVLTIAAFVTISPALIASTVVLLVFLVGGVIRTPSRIDGTVTTTHEVANTNPRPGEEVTVHTTVENTGAETLPDLRVVDAVPDELTVTTGTPRAGVVLQPEDSFEFEYDVVARRGTHTFDGVRVRSRSLFGSQWLETDVADANPAVIECAVAADNIPLEEQAAHYIGGLLGDTGGEGVEFYSTREYHRGDSPSRINWRELAKGGELSTVTFREHEAADVTVISDIRGPSRVTSGVGQPSTANLTMYAAYQIVTALVNAGHYTGMALPGIQPQNHDTSANTDVFPYARIQHGRGAEQRQQAFQLLTEVDRRVTDGSYTPRDITPPRKLGSGEFTGQTLGSTLFDVTPYEVRVTELSQQLSGWVHNDSQFIFISPLLDNGGQQLCLQLKALGFPVTVVSPTIPQPVIQQETPPDRAASAGEEKTRLQLLQRATRVESLRQQGLTVIDWETTKPLSTTVIQQTKPGAQ